MVKIHRKFGLLGVLLFLVLWQGSLWQSQLFTGQDKITSITGIQEGFSDFIPFYHLRGLFPLVSTEKNPLSVQEAEEILQNRPQELLMESGHSFRSGDYGKLFLFLPGAVLLKDGLSSPSVIPATGSLFLFSLLFLVIACYRHYSFPFGIFSALCLGSTPFLIYENYSHNNIFGLVPVLYIFLLALNMRIVVGKRTSFQKAMGLILISGVVIGYLTTVRTEHIAGVISLFVAYGLFTHFSIFKRGILLAVVLLSLFVSRLAINTYFDAVIGTTHKVVSVRGGHTFAGPRHNSHNFWHALFCGLGDFDKTHGYRWDDFTAAQYAQPIMTEKYNLPQMTLDKNFESNIFFDEAEKYPMRPFEFPEYGLILKEKILSDIAQDPFWYLGILAKRSFRLFYRSTGVAPIFGFGPIVPMPMLFALVYSWFLWKKKSWVELKILWFSLPAALVSLGIYSRGGTTFFPVVNVFFLALILSQFFGSQLDNKFLRRSS